MDKTMESDESTESDPKYDATTSVAVHKKGIVRLESVENSLTGETWIRPHGYDYYTISSRSRFSNLHTIDCRTKSNI